MARCVLVGMLRIEQALGRALLRLTDFDVWLR